MNRKPLTKTQIAEALTNLPGWQVKDGKLHKTFKFKDFKQAMGWMVQAAIEAEKLDHHPDWSNSWNKVFVDLVTHSAGGITPYDTALAQKMEELA